MGWNRVQFVKTVRYLMVLCKIVTSILCIVMQLALNEHSVAISNYGEFFCCDSEREFYGVQLHPERSGQNGALLLKNLWKKYRFNH